MKTWFISSLFALSFGSVCATDLPVTDLARHLPLNGTSFGFSNCCPESPDGQRIAYISFTGIPASHQHAIPVTLWICDQTLTNAQRFAVSGDATYLNGVGLQWLDNQYLIYEIGGVVHTLDTSGGRNREGVIGKLGRNSVNGAGLITQSYSVIPEHRGVFMMKAKGRPKRIISIKNLEALNHQFLTTPPSQWGFNYAFWSDDGERLAFRVSLHQKAKDRDKILVTCNKDGSDIVVFGPEPKHPVWFDSDSIAGHDHQVADGQPNDRSLRRWSRDGMWIEDLCAPGCHLAVSPDRTRFASESWYQSVPIELNLYGLRNSTATRTLMRHVDALTTWTLGGYVSPSFSRDGTRVYFNQADGAGMVRACFVDLPEE